MVFINPKKFVDEITHNSCIVYNLKYFMHKYVNNFNLNYNAYNQKKSHKIPEILIPELNEIR